MFLGSLRYSFFFLLVTSLTTLTQAQQLPQKQQNIQEHTYNLIEQLPPNTFICDVRSIANLSASPPLNPQQLNKLRFRFAKQQQQDGFSKNTKNDFSLNTKGVLSSLKTFDRDVLCSGGSGGSGGSSGGSGVGGDNESCYTLIIVQVTPVEYYQQIHLRIRLTDINDNVPTFPTTHFSINLTQSTPPATLIHIPSASDADSDLNSQLTYTLSPSTYSPFFAVYNHERSTNISLQLIKVLEEVPGSFPISISVKDTGLPSLSSSLSITINIIRPPRSLIYSFQQQSYSISVSENGPDVEKVLKVLSNPINHHNYPHQLPSIIYSIDKTSQMCAKSFFINPQSGWIYTRSSLDFETMPFCSFKVISYVSNSPIATNNATCNVTVYVQNIQEPDEEKNFSVVLLSRPVTGRVVLECGSVPEERVITQFATSVKGKIASPVDSDIKCHLNQKMEKLFKLETTKSGFNLTTTDGREYLKEKGKFDENIEVSCVYKKSKTTLLRVPVGLRCLPYFKATIFDLRMRKDQNVVDGEVVADMNVVKVFEGDQIRFELESNEEMNGGLIEVVGDGVKIKSPFTTPTTKSLLYIIRMLSDDDGVIKVLDRLSLNLEIPLEALHVLIKTTTHPLNNSIFTHKPTQTPPPTTPTENNTIIITAVVCATVVVIVALIVVAVVFVCCRFSNNKNKQHATVTNALSTTSSLPLVIDSSSYISNSLSDFNKQVMERSGSVSSTDQSCNDKIVRQNGTSISNISNVSNNTKNNFLSHNSHNNYHNNTLATDYIASSCNLSKRASSLEVVMEEATLQQQEQQLQLQLQRKQQLQQLQHLQSQQLPQQQPQQLIYLPQTNELVQLDSLPSSDETCRPHFKQRNAVKGRHKSLPRKNFRSSKKEDTDMESESGASYTDSGFYGDSNNNFLYNNNYKIMPNNPNNNYYNNNTRYPMNRNVSLPGRSSHSFITPAPSKHLPLKTSASSDITTNNYNNNNINNNLNNNSNSIDFLNNHTNNQETQQQHLSNDASLNNAIQQCTSYNDVASLPLSNNLRNIITHPFNIRKNYSLSKQPSNVSQHKRNGIKVGTGLQSIYHLPVTPFSLQNDNTLHNILQHKNNTHHIILPNNNNTQYNTFQHHHSRLKTAKSESFSAKKSHVSFSPTLEFQSDNGIGYKTEGSSSNPSPINNSNNINSNNINNNNINNNNINSNNIKTNNINNNNINNKKHNKNSNNNKPSLGHILKRNIFPFNKPPPSASNVSSSSQTSSNLNYTPSNNLSNNNNNHSNSNLSNNNFNNHSNINNLSNINKNSISNLSNSNIYNNNNIHFNSNNINNVHSNSNSNNLSNTTYNIDLKAPLQNGTVLYDTRHSHEDTKLSDTFV